MKLISWESGKFTREEIQNASTEYHDTHGGINDGCATEHM